MIYVKEGSYYVNAAYIQHTINEKFMPREGSGLQAQHVLLSIDIMAIHFIYPQIIG